jgi:flagellar protein FlaG
MNFHLTAVESGQASAPQRGGSTAASGIGTVAARTESDIPQQSAESVRQVLAAINRAAKSLNNSVQLSLDTQSGKAIVRVVDTETGQLVRQIPTEEVLELRRALDHIAGLLIHRTA